MRDTYAQVNGQGASLYAHEGGITAHAASGPVSIRAHTDVLQLLVEQGATVSSVSDEIRIHAKDKLSFGAADSGFELDGENVTFTTPGTYQEQGGSHAFLSGASAAAALQALPQGVVSEPQNWIAIRHTDAEGQPMAGQKYKIYFEGGSGVAGVLDASGNAHHDGVPKVAEYAEYEPREPQAELPWPALKQMVQAAQQKLG